MLFGLGTKAWSAITASVVLVSAVVAGVAMASDDDFDPVSRPAWQPGYTFSYDVSGTVDAFTNGLAEMGVPSDFAGEFGPYLVKKEVLNTADYTSSNEPLYVSAANFPLSNIQSGELLSGIDQAPTFLMAERQSDLAPLAVMPDWNCRSDDCASGGLRVIADNPLTYLDFPLTPGKRWVQEEDLPIPVPIEELAGITRVHIVGEVTGMETVDLGELGTTRAVRVDFAYRPVGLEDILAQFAAQAEDMGIDIERFNIQLGVHEIVHYSPDYEAIVKQQYLISVLFDVAFSGEFYGETFSEDIYAELNGGITAVLSGSNRAITEQQTPVQILQKLGNVDLIGDARGIQSGGITTPYAISLVPSGTSVNVADHEAITFAVGVAGDMPASHRLEYSVRSLDGAQVMAGGLAGDAFIVELAEPGVYGVTVRAYDENDQVVATSTTRFIEGDYLTTVSANCYIGILGTECEPFYFPVNAGAEHAVIEAYKSTSLPPLSQQLSVSGAHEMVYDGAGRRIELNAAEIAGMGLGEWYVHYSNVGGYLTQVDYLVKVDYAAPRLVHDTVEPQPDGEGGGMLSLLGRMVQTIDAGLSGVDAGHVQLDLRGVLG